MTARDPRRPSAEAVEWAREIANDKDGIYTSESCECARELLRLDALADAEPDAAYLERIARESAEARVARLESICHASYMLLPVVPGNEFAFVDFDITPHVRAVADEWSIREAQLRASEARVAELERMIPDPNSRLGNRYRDALLMSTEADLREAFGDEQFERDAAEGKRAVARAFTEFDAQQAPPPPASALMRDPIEVANDAVRMGASYTSQLAASNRALVEQVRGLQAELRAALAKPEEKP